MRLTEVTCCVATFSINSYPSILISIGFSAIFLIFFLLQQPCNLYFKILHPEISINREEIEDHETHFAMIEVLRKKYIRGHSVSKNPHRTKAKQNV